MRVTFKEQMEQILCEHGMPRRYAEIIVELAIKAPSLRGINHLWNKDINRYAPMMQDALWRVVRKGALDWIKTNYPEAPFRHRFETPTKGREIEI